MDYSTFHLLGTPTETTSTSSGTPTSSSTSTIVTATQPTGKPSTVPLLIWCSEHDDRKSQQYNCTFSEVICRQAYICMSDVYLIHRWSQISTTIKLKYVFWNRIFHLCNICLRYIGQLAIIYCSTNYLWVFARLYKILILSFIFLFSRFYYTSIVASNNINNYDCIYHNSHLSTHWRYVIWWKH